MAELVRALLLSALQPLHQVVEGAATDSEMPPLAVVIMAGQQCLPPKVSRGRRRTLCRVQAYFGMFADQSLRE